MENSMEYPKALFLEGWSDTTKCVIVFNLEEEQQAREAGYSSLDDVVEEVKPKSK